MASQAYDFVVVGSGVSGGRIACELTRGGAKCLLLEAGKRYSKEDFPKSEIDYSSQMFWGGGLELSRDGRMGFLRGKCLGGTSVVNQALLDEFDENAWQDWRDRTGIQALSSEVVEAHYRAIASELTISDIPEKHFNRNTRVFTQGFEKLGYRWSPLHRSQGDCKLDQGSDCIVCLGGCPRESKQSALVTTLRQAESRGLTIETECEVIDLEYRLGEITLRGRQRGELREWNASRVFLAGGSLGNSKLLLKSGFGKRLPALGHGFCAHPQFMTYGYFQDRVDAHKGAFQAVKSADPKLRQMGIKLENVFAQPIGTAMLFAGLGERHYTRMKRYRHLASIEVAIRDEATGVLRLGSNGKLEIQKKLTTEDWRKAKRGLSLVQEIFELAGAREIEPCMQVFGLHLMGGCSLGTDPARSVVSPEFQIHDLKGVYVADSSVFPSAPGINPSFTIMAMSRMAALGALQR